MKRIILFPACAIFFLSLSSTAFGTGFASSASSTGMSASSAGSNSLRASSGAISTSSTSASGEADVAAGQYRLTAMNTTPAAASSMATVRLTLTPLATTEGGFEFDLQVPERALQDHEIRPGDTIHVARESFGLEFAHGPAQRSFFLVLAQEWEQNLGTFQLQR